MDNWISVKDRLPSKQDRYIVFRRSSHSTGLDIVWYTPNYSDWDENLKGRAVWFKYDSEWGDYEVDNITHWMPLPEPPKKVR